MNLKTIKLALVGAALTFSGIANSALIPFAVTDASNVAEQLDYSSGAIDVNGAARITTDFANVFSNNWFQEVYLDGTNLSYSIEWKFSNNLTMAERFKEAVNTGTAVSWLVNAGGSQYSINGTWRWSVSSGLNTLDWSTSGSRFSNDDGIWGAGSYVDGQSNSNIGTVQWGLGNYNSSDSSLRLWNNGTVTTNNNANIRNIMYIKTTDVPEPSTLAIFALGIMGLASRRLKK